jgi:hypothetical protein
VEELVRPEEKVVIRLEGNGVVRLERKGLVRLEKKELARLEEKELDLKFAPDSDDIDAGVSVCANASIEEKGYGSSEMIRLVVQQSGPPRPCPGAPAQHQLLSLVAQRLTSVKPKNWASGHDM